MSRESVGRCRVVIGLNGVVVAVTDEVPRILTVPATEAVLPGTLSRRWRGNSLPLLPGLPFGFLDPAKDQTLDQALRQRIGKGTGLQLGYVEQLYTFGDRFRVAERGSSRSIAIAYLALICEQELQGGSRAQWMNYYHFLPWEDWRAGRPELVDALIAPALSRWARTAPGSAGARQRRDRAEIAFGLAGAPWDSERVLERYELLYEVGLVSEANLGKGALAGEGAREPAMKISGGAAGMIALGQPMVFDHRRMLAIALGRLRGKLKYRPLIFELLPPTFTLFQLQRVVEALAGVRLHKQNFRRLVELGRLVEGTGTVRTETGGRPAELFRFRREVLRERPAPGIGLPGVTSRR